MGHVIQRVTKHTTGVCSCCRIPVVEEDSVCKLPEGCCQRGKQCGWHDESVLVHGEVVVNAVEEEMKGEGDAVVGKVTRNVSILSCRLRVCTYSSRWNKHLWRTYSMMVQNPSPKIQ